jgi:hypothetical protein
VSEVLFIVFFVVNVILLKSQNPFELNGITVYQINDKLYNIDLPDTVQIDISHITIKYQEGVSNSIKQSIEQHNDLIPYYNSRNGNITYKIETNSTEYILMIEELDANQNIHRICFEHLLKYFLLEPSDPFWQAPNLEQIHITSAWNYTTGNPDIIIGLIDSGTAWDHPELKKGNDNYGNIFTNIGDTWMDPDDPNSGDGVDNDHNGYIDDYKGWDILEDNNDARPDLYYEYHGTSLAGLIAAKTNNESMVAGVAGGWWPNSPGVKIITIDVGDDGVVYTAVIPSAIDYAIKMGARILNFSWGGIGFYNENINEAINFAYSHSILMFAASGNEGLSTVAWPASHENVIAVGGMDQYGDCKWFGSNWGENTEITSVGVTACIDHNFINTVFYDQWGTSYACAIATGAGSLLLSYNPCLSNSEVREILINSAWKSTCSYLDPYNYNWNSNNPGHSKELGYGIIWLDMAFMELMSSYPVTNTQSISGTITWNEKKWVDGDITINSGATLTISNEVVMNKNKKITVSCGGKLIIDGGMITTTCQDFWYGIVVCGQYNQVQVYPYANQGYAQIKNEGKIEKAEYGIYVCDPVTNKGGGVVIAENALFINNKFAVVFAEYAKQNRSYFKNCTFSNDENFIPLRIPYFESIYPYYFVKLDNVNYIRFKGCQFRNDFEEREVPFGNGIYSYKSNFQVDGVCANTSNPCNDWIESVFYRLQYGVYAYNGGLSRNFTVKHSYFDKTHNGIYVSHVSDMKIVSNTFDLSPGIFADGFTYGIYMNSNCTGFQIEDNEFSSTVYGDDNTGLYIRNSSVMANWVHNNTFQHLKYGSIAEGINRHPSGTPGLCYKCNDFTNCMYDIRVVVPSEEEDEGEKGIFGIAEEQGIYGLINDTSAAGNTFTDNVMITNFDNLISESEIDYIMQATAQYNEKIFPYPSNDINLYTNSGTEYSKMTSCPSWLNSSLPPKGASEIIEEMKSEKAKANSVQQSLELLVDGGSTENLTQDVNTSFPPDALELRNKLMGKSPYLSDTVLESAINKENVLPNVMIRDILVANPQAAKSNEVMGAIDERFDPMPEYMKYEILQGQNILGAKELMEIEIARCQSSYSSILQSLLSIYRHDTLYQWPADSIVNLLNRVNSKETKYMLAEHYIEHNQYSEAQQLLQQIPFQFSLSVRELEENQDYETLTGILSDIHLNGLALNELYTGMITTLTELYERDNSIPGSMARNLLIAGGYLQYREPFTIGNELKSSPVYKPEDIFDKPANENVKLNLFPNPAKEYIIVEYEVTIPFDLLEIIIFDLHGRQTRNFFSNKDKDQRVLDIKNYPAGPYMVSLYINSTQYLSKKFNIVK